MLSKLLEFKNKWVTISFNKAKKILEGYFYKFTSTGDGLILIDGLITYTIALKDIKNIKKDKEIIKVFKLLNKYNKEEINEFFSYLALA